MPALGQTPGDGEGQGSLVCWGSQGRKESDMTRGLNDNNLISAKCTLVLPVQLSKHSPQNTPCDQPPIALPHPFHSTPLSAWIWPQLHTYHYRWDLPFLDFHVNEIIPYIYPFMPGLFYSFHSALCFEDSPELLHVSRGFLFLMLCSLLLEYTEFICSSVVSSVG